MYTHTLQQYGKRICYIAARWDFCNLDSSQIVVAFHPLGSHVLIAIFHTLWNVVSVIRNYSISVKKQLFMSALISSLLIFRSHITS